MAQSDGISRSERQRENVDGMERRKFKVKCVSLLYSYFLNVRFKLSNPKSYYFKSRMPMPKVLGWRIISG